MKPFSKISKKETDNDNNIEWNDNNDKSVNKQRLRSESTILES